MRSVVITLIALLAISCSNSKKAQETNIDGSSSAEPGEALFLSFERTQCFGECPAYRITVDTKGNANYEGIKWVERKGKYTSKLSSSQMKEISQMANEIGYFDLEKEYDGPVSDLPSTIITLSKDGIQKRVIDRYDAPKKLGDFEKFLDRILLNLDWKKV